MIFITGGSGFVGKSLLDHLNGNRFKKSPKVIIASRGNKSIDTAEWPHLNIQLIKSDLKRLNLSNLGPLSLVIHAATSTTPAESQNVDYLQAIYEGTSHLMDECKKNPPESFLYLSSGAVYGLEHKGVKFCENDRYAPTEGDLSQNYGHFKIKSESLCKTFYDETRIPVTIARLFAFAGKRLDLNGPFALTNFIHSALVNGSITINGDGSAVRSYMSDEDLSRWLLTIAAKNKSFEIINIGSDQPVSILELSSIIAQKLNCPVNVVGNSSERSNFYVTDTSKAQRTYGLTLKTDFTKTIDEMIKSYKKAETQKHSS